MTAASESSPIGPAQRRIVDHLKRAGACTTADLASALGVTAQAVRPPLAELEGKGLVVAEPVATGTRGRPPLGWALAPLAVALFPDRHGDLTVELISATRAALGDDGLEAVLLERDRGQVRVIEDRLPPEADIETRVAVLAQVRTEQGYMADVQRDGNTLVLTEHHCPVCAAATACQALCANELALFERIAGPDATVERTQHLLNGDSRCQYRITGPCAAMG